MFFLLTKLIESRKAPTTKPTSSYESSLRGTSKHITMTPPSIFFARVEKLFWRLVKVAVGVIYVWCWLKCTRLVVSHHLLLLEVRWMHFPSIGIYWLLLFSQFRLPSTNFFWCTSSKVDTVNKSHLSGGAKQETVYQWSDSVRIEYLLFYCTYRSDNSHLTYSWITVGGLQSTANIQLAILSFIISSGHS